MRKVIAGCVAALVSFASTVQAATLVAVSGQVLVNRGKGFELAQPGIDLKPGDIVVANPGATAQIMYPEGCLMPVTPGVIANVAAKAPCAPITTGANPPAPPPSGFNVGTGLLIGGAVVGAGAAIYSMQKKNSSPSSTDNGDGGDSGGTPGIGGANQASP